MIDRFQVLACNAVAWPSIDKSETAGSATDGKNRERSGKCGRTVGEWRSKDGEENNKKDW